MESDAAADDLLEAIAGFLRAEDIRLERGILVAASAGCDSTALLGLLALLRSRPPFPEFPLHALYVNHRLRTDAETRADIDCLRTAADRLGVECDIEDLGERAVEREAAAGGGGIEAAARRLRYRVLEERRERLSLGYIATGHTRDDQLETMVIRFLQGSGLSGISGIPRRRGHIIRPLLATPKEALRDFLSSAGLPSSEDSSNAHPVYQRNRIRENLIPHLLAEFPAAGESLLRVSRILREENDILEEESRRRLVWREEESQAAIEIDTFTGAPESLRLRSLVRLANRYVPGAERIPLAFLLSMSSPREGGEATLLEGHGIALRQRGDILIFSPSVVFESKTRYVMRVRGKRGAEAGGIRYSWRRGDLPGVGELAVDPYSCGELLLRSPRITDTLASAGGSLRIGDILSDMKVPEGLREGIPVLACDGNVIALFGSGFGFTDRFAVGIADRRTPNCPPGADILRIERVE